MRGASGARRGIGGGRRGSHRGAGLLIGLTCAGAVACQQTQTVDPPASALTVTITVIDTEEHPGDGKVPIVVQFFSGGSFVQLASTTTVSCNSVGMAWNGLGYAARVPLASPGGSYTCYHARSGVNSAATVVVPARPVIVSPANGASVMRSSTMTITYTADGGTGIRAVASDGTTAQGGTHEPEADNGTFTDLNTSAMLNGPGTIGLVRELSMPISSTPFQSVTAKYSAGAEISVTWM